MASHTKSSFLAWSISSCYLAQVLLLPPPIPRYPFLLWPHFAPTFILAQTKRAIYFAAMVRVRYIVNQSEADAKLLKELSLVCVTFYYLPTIIILLNPIHQSMEEWKCIGCKSSKMLRWVWWPSWWRLGMLGIQGTNV